MCHKFVLTWERSELEPKPKHFFCQCKGNLLVENISVSISGMQKNEDSSVFNPFPQCDNCQLFSTLWEDKCKGASSEQALHIPFHHWKCDLQWMYQESWSLFKALVLNSGHYRWKTCDWRWSVGLLWSWYHFYQFFPL